MSLFSYLYLLNPKTFLHSMALLYRAIAMAVYLENNDISCRITKFIRRRETAHRWSTAHHIVNGRIKIGALRALKDGRDRDGNLWYKQDWDAGYDDKESASRCELIRINAIKLGSPQTVYSEEGYEPGDPARLPNLQDIPISKHVFGLAIDALVDWSKLGGPWSAFAREVVTKFGLVRPVYDEEWHFEVNPGTLLVITHYIIVPPHRVAGWLIHWVARNWKGMRTFTNRKTG